MMTILACAVLLVSAQVALGGMFYGGNPSYNMNSYNSYGSPSSGYGSSGFNQRSNFPANSYASASSSSFGSFPQQQARHGQWGDHHPSHDNWPSNGLPSSSSVTEEQLFGGIDIHGLIKPYSSGDNSEINEKPVRLPDIVEWVHGPTREYDHKYAPIHKTQQVVSNKRINTFTEQTHKINIDEKEKHRHHKAINVHTDYILNIDRVNQPSKWTQTLTQIQEFHKPIVHVVHRKNDIINDNKPVDKPLIVKETFDTVRLPPIIKPPVIKKYTYDQTPSWASGEWPSHPY